MSFGNITRVHKYKALNGRNCEVQKFHLIGILHYSRRAVHATFNAWCTEVSDRFKTRLIAIPFGRQLLQRIRVGSLMLTGGLNMNPF